jgi:hypothetical protein
MPSARRSRKTGSGSPERAGSRSPAVREEVARDRTGAAPTHARLKEIGFAGWSEVLSARAGA